MSRLLQNGGNFAGAVACRMIRRSQTGSMHMSSAVNPYDLEPDPIPRDWILDGNPTARRKLLVGSSDDMASTHMWDCTSGRFNWFYRSDEVIYVLEGSVLVEDDAGVKRQLAAG